MQFILNNKEWILSGIGVVLLGGIIKGIKVIYSFIINKYRLKHTYEKDFTETLDISVYE